MSVFLTALRQLGISCLRLDDATACPTGELVQRFDLAVLKSPVRTREGFIRAQGTITRAGIFREPFKGRLVNELRPPDEVFSAKSLASYALMPLTVDHPPIGLLTPATVRQFQVGSVGAPIVRGDVAIADLLITDVAAIAAVEAGKTALSCGYTSMVYEVPGTFKMPDGQVVRFDTIQTDIVGNHLAIVEAGRAGPEAVIRMDSAALLLAPMPEISLLGSSSEHKSTSNPGGLEPRKGTGMKIKIGSTEIEVDDNVAAALQTERADAARSIRESSVALDAAKAEQSKLAGQLAAQAATQVANQDEAKLAARLELIARCAPVLGKAPAELVRLDSAALMRAVIAVKAPGIVLDNRDEAFIAGAFETVMLVRHDSAAQLRTAVGQAAVVSSADAGDPIEAARLRMLNHYTTSWQSTPTSLAQLVK